MSPFFRSHYFQKVCTHCTVAACLTTSVHIALKILHEVPTFRDSFLKHTRAYNNALAMASIGFKEAPVTAWVQPVVSS